MSSSLDPALDPADLKACCAAGYSSDLVAMLLGESYHPGGLRLTRRLLDALRLEPDTRLVDVATGRGGTALLAASEYGVAVDGVDLSQPNLDRAVEASSRAGLGQRTSFVLGDAESLPQPDGRAAAVVCECALCTFPDKTTAVAEMARVLAPGGRVGITDVAADRDRLPDELTGLSAWIACVADARPLGDYVTLLEDAGLRVTLTERHTEALTRMIDQIEARLGVLKMTAREQVEELGLDFELVTPVLGAARRAAADGVLDYVLLVAEKPAAGSPR